MGSCESRPGATTPVGRCCRSRSTATPTGPTSVRDIAERTGLPQPYLEQILLALKGAGLVRSKRGVGGGYVLARDPEDIRLSEIVSAVDGPITLGDFGQPHQDGACDHEGQCVLHRGLERGRRAHAPPPRRLHARRRSPAWPRATRPGRPAPWRAPARSPRPSPPADPGGRSHPRVSVHRSVCCGASPHETLGCAQTLGWVGSRVARTDERSAGSGLVNVRRSPVAGWSNDSSAAWRNGRSRPSVVRRSPYVGSPTQGMADGGEVDADLVRPPGLQHGTSAGPARPG